MLNTKKFKTILLTYTLPPKRTTIDENTLKWEFFATTLETEANCQLYE